MYPSCLFEELLPRPNREISLLKKEGKKNHNRPQEYSEKSRFLHFSPVPYHFLSTQCYIDFADSPWRESLFSRENVHHSTSTNYSCHRNPCFVNLVCQSPERRNIITLLTHVCILKGLRVSQCAGEYQPNADVHRAVGKSFPWHGWTQCHKWQHCEPASQQ